MSIVREIPHFDVFPAFSPERPAFMALFLEFFLEIVIIFGAGKKCCA